MKVIKTKQRTPNIFINNAVLITARQYLITFCFFKNNKIHNSKFYAVIGIDLPNHQPTVVYAYYYKNDFYGNDNNFTNKSWKKKVKQLKQEEKLKVFI